MKRMMKPMNCRTFRHHLASGAAAGRVETDAEMAAHAQRCPECRARMAALTALDRAQRMPVKPPVDLETRVLANVEHRWDERRQTEPEQAGRQDQRGRTFMERVFGDHRGPVTVSGPALAAAAVVLIALTAVVTTLVNRAATQPVPIASVERVAPPTAGSEVVEVHLVLEAPGAQSVAVAGDWNDWDTSVHRLTDPDGDGTWELRFRVKAGREYEYQFVVDESTWISDPQALIRVEDGFGGTNSILDI